MIRLTPLPPFTVLELSLLSENYKEETWPMSGSILQPPGNFETGWFWMTLFPLFRSCPVWKPLASQARSDHYFASGNQLKADQQPRAPGAG